MRSKVDAQDLPGIVEELTRIQRAEEDSLDRQQAQDVLRELDLPAERIDEARAALSLRRARELERSKRIKLAKVVAAALLLGGLALGWRAHSRSQALEQMGVTSAALTIGGASGPAIVSRAALPKVGFELVLQQPPQGVALDLRCDWRGPAGDLRHQNRWLTKAVDKDVWPTHCSRVFDASDPQGAWSVAMQLGEQQLAIERFTVE